MENKKTYQLPTTLSFRIENAFLYIIANKKEYTYSSHLLFVFSLFTQAITLAEVGKKLNAFALTKSQLEECFVFIQELIKNNILQTSQQSMVTNAKVPTDGWGRQKIHKEMLNDTVRTLSFEKAIASCVKDKVVLDIGCGTGILSFFAIKHGAKHVYAIDSNAKCINYAQNMAKTNGLDNITFIHKSCFNAELPEKADVLISEVIGNLPLGENILAIFDDAKKRLLKPNAILIPHNLQIFATPVSFSTEDLPKHYFTQKETAMWQHAYQFDFEALLQPGVNTHNHLFLWSKEVENFTLLGPKVLIKSYHFQESTDFQELDLTKNFSFNTRGQLNGFLISFESALHQHITLSTDPQNIDLSNSWRYFLYPFHEQSCYVVPNEELEIHITSHNTSSYRFKSIKS